jgi:bifunctional non-homologous end joining protein LigD
MNTKTLSALPKVEIRFIEPMYARLVQELPEGKEWLYEVKFDGYRCLAGRDGKGVILWSRRGNLFTKQFPHIDQACERLPRGTLVDGEIVALDATGGSLSICCSITVRRRRHCSFMCSTCWRIVAAAW